MAIGSVADPDLDPHVFGPPSPDTDPSIIKLKNLEKPLFLPTSLIFNDFYLRKMRKIHPSNNY
jgi:hypothetical protein